MYFTDFSQFERANIHPIIVENLKLAGYNIPTPVQAAAIKPIQTGRDILLTAQTGKFPLILPCFT